MNNKYAVTIPDEAKRLRWTYALLKLVPQKFRKSLTSRFYFNVWENLDVVEESYIFDSFAGREVSCNPLAIFKKIISMASHREVKITWVVQPEASVPDVLNRVHGIQFVVHNSLEHLVELTRSKYVIYNSTLPISYIPKSSQVILSTWHGVPIKTLGLMMNDERLAAVHNTQRCFNLSNILLSNGAFYSKYALVF